MGRSKVTSEHIQHELTQTAETLPIYPVLTDLFKNGRMFDSFDKFGSEGFKLVKHAEHKIMSGAHKRAPGYLFKKYNNDKPGETQLVNYMFRVEGARLIRGFIEDRGFSCVVAPRKWLYELPPSFPKRYLVVAEKLDLASDGDTNRGYDRISKEQMHELATILYHFRGLNSTASNLPFTQDGRISFIDTERWHHDKDYLRKVGDRLSSDRKKLAQDVYKNLAHQGVQPYQSAFRKRSRRDREEDHSDDFEREEDTSSSSSSSSSFSS